MHYGVLLDRKLTCCFYIQLNRFGRRIPHSLMMMTGGFTCLMVLAVGKGKFWYLVHFINNRFVFLIGMAHVSRVSLYVQILSILVNGRFSFKCLFHIYVCYLEHTSSPVFRSEGRYNCLSFHWSFYGKWIIFQYIPVFHGVVPYSCQVICIINHFL